MAKIDDIEKAVKQKMQTQDKRKEVIAESAKKLEECVNTAKPILTSIEQPITRTVHGIEKKYGTGIRLAFGIGVELWLRSNGDLVEIVETAMSDFSIDFSPMSLTFTGVADRYNVEDITDVLLRAIKDSAKDDKSKIAQAERANIKLNAALAKTR